MEVQEKKKEYNCMSITTAEIPTEMRTDEVKPAKGHGLLSIASSLGETRLTWDTSDDAQVAVATKAFNEAKADGMLAYTVTDGGSGEVIRDFDPQEHVNVAMTRQLQGG